MLPGTALRERFVRTLCALEDRLFDVRHRIETHGFIPQDGLSTDSGHRSHASAFQSTWCRTVREVLARVYAAGYKPPVFIDLGCGKGRACFCAAAWGRFSRVVGLEFDASLVEKARANARSFVPRTGPSIEFVHGDAASYRLDDSPSLVFMFNPFDAVVLRLFMANNLESLRKNGHLVAYANDLHRSVLEEFGLTEVFGDRRRKISIWVARGPQGGRAG